jgi:predicted PurR-regulated permease PerM
MKPQKIEISYKTIVFAVLFLISLVLIWQLRGIFLLLFLCFIFMQALNPTVSRLERLKIPRFVGILLIYFIILIGISFAAAGIIPALVEQTTSLIETLPNTISNINLWGIKPIDISSQFKLLENLPSNIATTLFSIFSNIVSVFVFFVLTFYLLIERKNLDKYAVSIFGQKNQDKVILIMNELEKRLGNWVNAQLFLMLTIGVLSYIGYLVIGLNYVVPLAIIAGLLEIVTNIGPTIATVIAAFVGLTVSPLTALMAIAWGIIVQQLENNFIVPKVMKATIGLNPLITILLIASGAQLGGVVGAVLAIPTYLTISTIVSVLNKK